MTNNFEQFSNMINAKFNKLASNGQLFRSNVSGDDLWDLYLNTFKLEDNPVFRERTEHDCSCCRHFIHSYGDIVSIKNGNIDTIWNVENLPTPYDYVAKALDKFVRDSFKEITDVALFDIHTLGNKTTKETLDDGKVINWSHFYADVPSNIYTRNAYDKTIEFRNNAQILNNSLKTISIDSIDIVLDLIAQNSLYRGSEQNNLLVAFKKVANDYKKSSNEFFSWENAKTVLPAVAHIKNSSIGSLLEDITKGIELDEAVRMYESKVAPENYKRSKPIFTKKMLEDAKKKVSELGLENSLGRRFAVMEDIPVEQVLFANRDVVPHMAEGSMDVFDKLEKKTKLNPKKFDNVETISIKDFVEKVLPNTTSVEAYFDNKHQNKLVSLIAPKDKYAKPITQWKNGMSWAYKGNVTDSLMQKRVKELGGKINGDLRFSIMWNAGEEYNQCDYDAHCIIQQNSRKKEIFFGNKCHGENGSLDVDIIYPGKGTPAVENIVFIDKKEMDKGTYKFFVHNYNDKGGSNGFTAEIALNGTVYKFNYPHALRQDEVVEVGTVTYKDDTLTLKPAMEYGEQSLDLWNVKTNDFTPVSLIMRSPNFWENGNHLGNEHYFFILKDCKNSEQPNGFFNEFLSPELKDNRKVFEALGSEMKVEPSDNQLSGLGFSTTLKDELLVKVTGSITRTLKIIF